MRTRIGLSVALALAAFSAAAVSGPKPAPYAVIRTFDAGDAFWDYGVFDDASHRLFLGRENGVTAIDVDTGKVVPQFVEGKQVHAVVLLDGNRALATNGALAKAVIFDRSTGKILASIPTGEKPDGAVIEPVTGDAVIMDGIGHDAVFADPQKATVLGQLPLGGEPGTPIPDGHGLVFSAISGLSEIAVIDARTRKLVTQYKLPQCDDAAGLARDADTGVLLVTCANEKAIAVDSRSGHVLGTVPIAKYPDVIQFDPARKVFYVPCIPGRLFVIAEGTGGVPRIAASVQMPVGVHTEALDTKGGVLYLPAGTIIFPKHHGERPGVVPGTFRILAINVAS
ncbi:MAG TPA: YncE family protein [Rhizomicrobium sp.]|nr:YncE family protein [Rhizomicrobium sp.]